MKKISALLMTVAVLSSQLHFALSEQQTKFVITHEKANWHKAAEHCNKLGMRQPVIDGQETENELKQAMMASNIYKPSDTVVWIGASDLAEEAKFSWHVNGQQVTYTNWARNQPDNSRGDEDCVVFGHLEHPKIDIIWEWNDASCTASNYIACENVSAD